MPGRTGWTGRLPAGGVAYGERVGQLLLGGLITLAGTAIVQIFIIPWVQTRNRRRERWEGDVIELETLLHDELPDAIAAARTSAERYLGAKRDAHPAQAAVVSFAGQLKSAATDDAHELLEIIRSVRTLEKRVRLVNRRAFLWATLQSDLRLLTEQLGRASEAWRGAEEDDAAHRHVWTVLQDCLDNAVQTLELVSIPMKPPPANKLSAWLFRRRFEKAYDPGDWTQYFRRAYERAHRADAAEGPHVDV